MNICHFLRSRLLHQSRWQWTPLFHTILCHPLLPINFRAMARIRCVDIQVVEAPLLRFHHDLVHLQRLSLVIFDMLKQSTDDSLTKLRGVCERLMLDHSSNARADECDRTPPPALPQYKHHWSSTWSSFGPDDPFAGGRSFVQTYTDHMSQSRPILVWQQSRASLHDSD